MDSPTETFGAGTASRVERCPLQGKHSSSHNAMSHLLRAIVGVHSPASARRRTAGEGGR